MKLIALNIEKQQESTIAWINPEMIVSVLPQGDIQAIVYLSNGQVYMAEDITELNHLMDI